MRKKQVRERACQNLLARHASSLAPHIYAQFYVLLFCFGCSDWSIFYTSTHREHQPLLLSTNGTLRSGESKQETMHLFGHVLTLDSFFSGSSVPARPSPVIRGQCIASLSHIRKPLEGSHQEQFLTPKLSEQSQRTRWDAQLSFLKGGGKRITTRLDKSEVSPRNKQASTPEAAMV